MSFTPDSSERDSLDYGAVSLRFGAMLSDPGSFLGGNQELLLEVFGGGIFRPRKLLGGRVGVTIIRHNFVRDEAKWVPYVQIGAGGVYSDEHEDQSQTLIGQELSFNLQVAVGLRYHISSDWAATVEAGYRHISNADTADRNTGVDSLGLLIGVSHFF